MAPSNNRKVEHSSVQVGTGYSTSADSFKAGKEAATKSIEFMKKRYNLKEFNTDALTLTMVFSSTYYKLNQKRKELEEMLKGVRSVTAGCPLVGCTTAGEITTQGVHDNSVSVMTLSSEVISAGTGVGENIIKDAPGAGKKAVSDALDKMSISSGVKTAKIKQGRFDAYIDPAAAIKSNPFLIIMFPQGRVLPEFILYDDEIIRGIRKRISFPVPIIGGSSADGTRMKRSYQFCDGQVYRRSVVCAVLFSLVNVGFHVSHPFVPMSIDQIEKRPKVTKLKEQYPPLFLVNQLFSLKPHCMKYLKNGDVDDKLRKEFENNRQSLSDKAKVIKTDEKYWDIVEDNKPKYIIEDTGTKLDVYPSGIKRGYTILELDDEPAAKRYFELIKDKKGKLDYKEWLNEVGDKPLHLLENGKLVFPPFGLTDLYGNTWMKKISSIKNDGSIELTSLIPHDSILSIMTLRPNNTYEELVNQTAEEAISGAMVDADITNPEEIAVVFVFDCAARYWNRENQEHEFEAMKKATGINDTPIIGLYSYGEQLSTIKAPVGRLEQTCTVMVLSQKLARVWEYNG